MSLGTSAQTAAAPEQGERWRPRHNPWAIALTVTLATFMEVLDTSIANVALPHIAGALSATVDQSTWVLTSYLVANGIILPISGWLSGFMGRKRFYLSCVALFTLSSLLCGLAPSLPFLIFFRVLQGAGGGGLQPSEQSILADTFAPEQFGMAFAVYGMAVVLAPTIGPTLGGWITDNYSWRWVFFINVPIGICSLLLSYRIVEDPPYIRRQMQRLQDNLKIDYAGLALVAVGLGLLQVVLDKGQEKDWFGSSFITSLTVLTAIALALFVVRELRYRHPVLDLALLRRPTFAIANGMMFVVGVVLYGSTVLIPLYLQQIMGYSAQQAGMALSPGGLVMMVSMPIAGWMLTRFDPRWLLALGFLVIAVSLRHMTSLNPGIDFNTAMTYWIYQSVGLAFLFVPINTMAYVGIPQEKSAQVSSLINLCRNEGGSVGISLVTTVLARRAQFHQQRLTGSVSPDASVSRNALARLSGRLLQHGVSAPDTAARAHAILYAGLQAQAAVLAYIDSFWLLAVMSLSFVPLAFLMRKPEPGSVRPGGH
jgi:DHA2 family multidrug resistance protein